LVLVKRKLFFSKDIGWARQSVSWVKLLFGEPQPPVPEVLEATIEALEATSNLLIAIAIISIQTNPVFAKCLSVGIINVHYNNPG
jgi:hypothetical protein